MTHSNRCGIGIIKKFEERKFKDASTVEKIIIDSKFANVTISASSSSQICAYLHGQADTDVESHIDFEVQSVNDELTIVVKFTGSYYGDLNLEVFVPRKVFKTIYVSTSSAKIVLNENVSTQYLKLKSLSGNLETNANFTNASFSTMSGNIELFVKATQNLIIDISTTNGNVSAKLDNIRIFSLYSTSNGKTSKLKMKKDGTHTADVDFYTSSGKLIIQ